MIYQKLVTAHPKICQLDEDIKAKLQSICEGIENRQHPDILFSKLLLILSDIPLDFDIDAYDAISALTKDIRRYHETRYTTR